MASTGPPPEGCEPPILTDGQESDLISRSATEARSNSQDDLDLNAIITTAFTSNPASGTNEGAGASATASGPRLSTSDLFAPNPMDFYEDSPEARLFAESDHEDEGNGEAELAHPGSRPVEALFIDTSSPRPPLTSSGPPLPIQDGLHGLSEPQNEVYNFSTRPSMSSEPPAQLPVFPSSMLTSTPAL